MLKLLGETPTGRLVNSVRLFVALLGLVAIAVSIGAAAVMLRATTTAVPWTLWAALGLFIGGMVLVTLSANYKIKSNPFLMEYVLQEAHRSKASPEDIARLIKALEAHTGIAGVFNRLDFTGASLGTVGAAVLVLLIGLLARKQDLVADYNIFADIAKLLFGAFVGSYAGRPSAGTGPPPANSPERR